MPREGHADWQHVAPGCCKRATEQVAVRPLPVALMGLARKNLEKEPDRVPQDPHFFKWATRVHAVLSRRASLRMQLVHAAAIGSGERELQRPRFELRTY